MTVWHQTSQLDEISGPSRMTREGHVVRGEDGIDRLIDWDENPGDPLADGEIVRFTPFDDYGEALLAIADDWSWTVSPQIPAGASYVGTHDPDDMVVGDVAAFVEQWRESGRGAGKIDVRFYHYGDDEKWRWDAAARAFIKAELQS